MCIRDRKKTEEKTVLSEKEATEYIDKITRALIYGESRQELQDLLYVKAVSYTHLKSK